MEQQEQRELKETTQLGNAHAASHSRFSGAAIFSSVTTATLSVRAAAGPIESLLI
jgi:hypothetical protein